MFNTLFVAPRATLYHKSTTNAMAWQTRQPTPRNRFFLFNSSVCSAAAAAAAVASNQPAK
jgi:hypothetical protein